MTMTYETRVSALAHHMAFFTVMAVSTCETEEADSHTDMALTLWLEEHGYPEMRKNNQMAIEAMKEAQNIVAAAVRVGRGSPSDAGRWILERATEAGLSRYQFIQKQMH